MTLPCTFYHFYYLFFCLYIISENLVITFCIPDYLRMLLQLWEAFNKYVLIALLKLLALSLF